MAALPLEKEIYYPESDGEPMAETELHLDEMVYVCQSLKKRFKAEPDVFVGANLFLYYRKGDPTAVVAPDGFVVKGVPKRLPGNRKRRTYRLWEEGQAPCFVLETTSASTLREDKDKRKIYEQLGVDEYFQFDPEGDYLEPRLQGLRLVDGRYREVQPEPDGSLLSQATGVLFRADGCELRLTDAVTGEPLLREEEEEEALRESEEARRTAEEARRKAVEERRKAEERTRALEEELARLRRQTPA
jgi:Uma2 family endonuclease